MRITKALRDYLLTKGWIAADATDDQVRQAVTARWAAGEIGAATIAQLTQEEGTIKAQEAVAIIDQTVDSLAKAGLLKDRPTKNTPTPGAVFGGGGGVRVKGASERYATTKSAGLHHKTGKPVLNPAGHEAAEASQKEAAMTAAWLAWTARKSGRLDVPWNDHLQGLLDEAVNEHTWLLQAGDETLELSGVRVRAVLDDSTSGGTSLVPEFVDSAIVAKILLTGELVPFCTLRDVGTRTIRQPTMGTPSVVWGLPPGTSTPLFDTTNLVGAFSSIIQPVSCDVEVGMDMLADSAPDFGQALIAQIASAFLASLDTMVATGDGVTQPLGIFNTAGLATVPTINGPGTPAGMGDLEDAYFGLPKQYKRADLRPSFVGNTLNYRRFRAIPVAAGWNARVLGQDYSSYQVLELPYRVAETAPNNEVAVVSLARYFLYRRAGFVSQWVINTDADLVRRNVQMLHCRGRWGGRLVDPNAAVILTDLPPS